MLAKNINLNLGSPKIQVVVPSREAYPLDIPKLSFLGRLWIWQNRSYYTNLFEKAISNLNRQLDNQGPLTIEEADSNQLIAQSKALLRSCRIHKITPSNVQELRKKVLAAKLGIPDKILEENPTFASFANQNHLERYLKEYRETLHISPKGELLIKMNGEYVSWEKAFFEFQNKPKVDEALCEPWIYGPEGLQKKNMYNWKELIPYKKEDPAQWHYQYIFEFCACTNPETIKNGNHSWLRLKTPTGDIYSVGLYRPGKPNPLTDTLKLPLKVKPGYLMQPDVSEFWPFPIIRISIAITEKQFLAMKNRIEEDKKNDAEVFQLFNNNCTLYSNKIASEANVKLPTSVRLIELIFPPLVTRLVKNTLNYLPILPKILDIAQAFFFNILQLILGASLVDQNLNPRQKLKAVPHIQSLWDLFKVEKASLDHPIALTCKAYKKILKWREKKIKKIEEKNLPDEIRREAIIKILFGVSKKYINCLPDSAESSNQRSEKAKNTKDIGTNYPHSNSM